MKPQNLVWLLAVTACSPAPSSNVALSTTEDSGENLKRDHTCIEAAPEADGTDMVTAIEETGGSYHEMIACGQLAMQVSRDLNSILVTSLLNSNGVELTAGFVYDGEGKYVSANDTTDMVVSYLYGDDLEAGAEDELVTHDLFDFDNYLRGITPDIDLASGDLLVHWNTKGPLIELLGRGANPPNPMRFGIDELDSPHKLGRLKMVTEVEVVDSRAAATVTYTLGSQPKRINPLLSSGELAFDSLQTETITERGAILRTTSWGIGYLDHTGVLDGDVDFEMESGVIAVEGTFAFDNAPYPEIGWTCVE